MASDCSFCDASNLGRIIEETDLSLVFLSNPSLMKGHTLVIPKRHAWQPWDLTEDEVLDIHRLMNKYRQKLESVIGEGSDIRQHYRPYVEESKHHNIRHLHYHILPRSFGDDLHQKSLQFEHSTMISENEIKEMGEALE